METAISRLETLRNRYEKLIVANQNNGYIYCDKAGRYLKAIQSIKTQIFQREAQNRAANANSQVSQFLKASSGMNGFQILTAIA